MEKSDIILALEIVLSLTPLELVNKKICAGQYKKKLFANSNGFNKKNKF